MDNIEKHIKQHRKEFDVDFPNKHKLWDNIEQNIGTIVGTRIQFLGAGEVKRFDLKRI